MKKVLGIGVVLGVLLVGMVGTSVFAELSEMAVYDSDATVSTTHSISVPNSELGITTIDFNDVDVTSHYAMFMGGTYSEKGFTLYSDTGNSSSLGIWGGFSEHFLDAQGMFFNNFDDSVTLTKDDDEVFDLIGISLANLLVDSLEESYYQNDITKELPITFYAQKEDGSTVSQTHSLNGDLTYEFHPFTFEASFQDITSVKWGASDNNQYSHQFDDIVLETGRSTAVPEPTTVASMVIGGLILGGSVLRKKK